MLIQDSVNNAIYNNKNNVIYNNKNNLTNRGVWKNEGQNQDRNYRREEISQEMLIFPAPEQENVEVAGVCDINRRKGKEVAEKFGIKYAVSDANDLLSIECLDAVSICTSNSSHCALALAAAEAGKHILCENLWLLP